MDFMPERVKIRGQWLSYQAEKEKKRSPLQGHSNAKL